MKRVQRISHLAVSCLAAAAAVCFGFPTPNAQGLDFRLHVRTVQEDGNSLERSYFQGDRENIVYFELPRDWTSQSDERSITASSINPPNCLIKVEKSALATDLPFKGKGLETYRHSLSALIPREATGIRIEKENEDPLPVFGWTSYEFVVNYDLLGQSFKRSLIFIDINAKEQIVVSAVAPVASFDVVRNTALQTMRSWCPVPVK